LLIRNSTTGQSSHNVAMTTASNGDVSVTLDSVLTLNQGNTANRFDAMITVGNKVITYPLRVLANSANATSGSSGLACYDPASLAMLNTNDQQVNSYVTAAASYKLRLNRSPAELTTVTARATSVDTFQVSGWGDAENITLPLASSSTSSALNQSNAFPFNGASPSPTPGNGTLESNASGKVVFRWSHPRDPKDSAHLELGSVPAALGLKRLTDVVKGVPIPPNFPANANPAVLRDGSSLGACISASNCQSAADNITRGLNPDRVPNFELRTDAPFRFTVYLYDNLGRFVNQATDSVSSAKWQKLHKDPSGSATIVLSLAPVAKSGQQLGTGVYLMQATVTTASPSGSGGVSQKFKPVQFGYIRP